VLKEVKSRRKQSVEMKLTKRVLLLSLLICCTQLAFSQGYKVKTIVIDAGHGGNKPGAAGSFSLEKNVALQVALKLGLKFEADMPELKVILTRKTDVDVDFYKRPK
jgi:N-acetylmuramoyl-L-alanine amidase